MTTPNYTPEMVDTLRASAPLDFDKAQALAKTLDRNVRSVIAKAKREGIEIYQQASSGQEKSRT